MDYTMNVRWLAWLSPAVLAGLSLVGSAWWLWGAEVANPDQQRAAARQKFRDGNFADAYQQFRPLLLMPESEPRETANDLSTAVDALQRLGRISEVDALLDAVTKAQAGQWRVLQAAARTLLRVEHYGHVTAGEFERGGGRGGGEFVNVFSRDRVTAWRWMEQARPLVQGDADRAAVGEFYLSYAEIVRGENFNLPAWKLQILTDLNELPEWEEQARWWGRYGGSETRGAPVGDNGEPILYAIPESWDKARNDGERWRWLHLMAKEADASVAPRLDLLWASFLESQFGPQTLLGYLGDDTGAEDAAGPFSLPSLGDEEMLARLATGIRRLRLPAEYNYLAVLRSVFEGQASPWNGEAGDQLAAAYQNRRQYDRAADVWKESLKRFGAAVHRQQSLDQIVGNWGQFEPTPVQPAGGGTELALRFRNAKQVKLVARAVKIPQLLDDVKKYLQSNPRQLDWQQIAVSEVGYRLVTEGQEKYLGEEVARWTVDLEPKPKHADAIHTIATPLQKGGAYLVTAEVAGGNTSRVVVWVADTAIVKKMSADKVWYYVADAVTGQPLPKTNIEFLGWNQQYIPDRQNEWRLTVRNFAEFTDANGLLALGNARQPSDYQWLAIARGEKGRLGFLGFGGVWYSGRSHEIYDQSKAYVITDRPVYRPEQTVKFKIWLQRARYDQPDQSPFAKQQHTVQIHNPQGEKVFEQTYTTDEYGGLSGEWPLAAEPMLGSYQLMVPNFGGGSFRIEEYKKPEFEVLVEAPKTPVSLGDKFTATIRAKYYFGAPVTKATVKYKVERTPHTARWYPVGPWDWLYGSGSSWLGQDYLWYPGFRRWGCIRPVPDWWGRPAPAPELVAEQEVEIGPDGTVAVEIETTLAKQLHGDQDHAYRITAEVVDQSRRTIVGGGQVLVAREPFQVTTWIDRGYVGAGQTVRAQFSAYTLDQQPVPGPAKLTLLKITYDDKGEPQEAPVESWDVVLDAEGRGEQTFVAAAVGQYRLSLTKSAAPDKTIEGATLFLVRGDRFDGREFRFNDLELVTDKSTYAPGETVKLLVNTNRTGGTVVLWIRPTGHDQPPTPVVVRLDGKSTVQDVPVFAGDMPNFFVEAITVSDGKLHSQVQNLLVPPVKRVLDVTVEPSQQEYLPGEKAKLTVRVKDAQGRPYQGSTVVSVYDRSVDAIAGGSNVPEIREFFWKWQRHYWPQRETNLDLVSSPPMKPNEVGMSTLGIFGNVDVAESSDEFGAKRQVRRNFAVQLRGGMAARGLADSAPAPAAMADGLAMEPMAKQLNDVEWASVVLAGDSMVEPTVRKEFADTAYWNAAVTTDADGVAQMEFPMPENLTGWKIRVWSMGLGAQVGEGTSEVVTRKNLLVRLQAPRFFVETDEVVLSANIMNKLASRKSVRAVLEVEGDTLQILGPAETTVDINASDEARVDWKVKVIGEGTAIVRMKALTDEESDAMQMTFPVYVHGMLKTTSYSGAIRPEEAAGKFTFNIPAQRRVNDSRVEVRYSPTLAGAMIEALPYLVDYPYGCTEQTLNRFLPTVITQRILQRMQIDLASVREHQTNLNAQQLGDPHERAAQNKPWKRNPVYDPDEVVKMVKEGVDRLTAMQVSDGGWGWFSGYGERSYAHTTAVVVHGLQIAQQNEIALVPGMLDRGIAWLERYRNEQIERLRNAPEKKEPYKTQADALDAFVDMVLVDAGRISDPMREFLFRDRIELPVYAKAMFGLSLKKQNLDEPLQMILQNIGQFVVEDNENQTAYLRLPENNWWWYWYGSEIEANAYYLKLLTAVNPQDPRAPRLVKYLLNNRQNGTYWKSTRDTALAIEAMAEYLTASGEDQPQLALEIWLDGKKVKDLKIDQSNLFTFDGTYVLTGDAVTTGDHTLEIRKAGKGPLYFNAYVTNFTQEDFITKAGLEVKVDRQYFKLTPETRMTDVVGSRGQSVQQQTQKYVRTPIENLAEVTSGDLVEVELEITSKNDYEYLMFEDLKASGFEPVDQQSGYRGDALGTYIEFRDERTAFFIRWLPRGRHSISYRLRAEIPGKFSALPARAEAMYAPELKANSDEMKVQILDKPIRESEPAASE